ncbi:MAG: hypothetical protein K9L59_02060 [Desulfobacterales bacterium]|nr:hypothetical protein [Desulfobacterales bacterium]
MKSSLYSAFGLVIRSSERISNLPTAACTGQSPPADIQVEFTSGGKESRPDPDEILLHAFANPENCSSPFLLVWKHAADGDYRFRFDSSVEFKLQRSGRKITVACESSTTMDEVAAYLLGPVMGLALRINGLVCLHASAVVFKNRAIALMAPPGHGKSTLAAAFAKRGHPVLTDDILVLVKDGNQLKIQPSYPQIRLLPVAVETLFGHREALPRLSRSNPNLSKHVLDLTGPDYRFAEEATILNAVYTGLESDQASATRVKDFNCVERFLAMCANLYLPNIIDEKMHRTHFEVLENAAKAVPVRCIETPCRNAMTPFDLCDLILDDYNSLQNISG